MCGEVIAMNVSTGGPHLLLFERDQQLAALIASELQLAGYECHVARTAVEVFDAIARHQVRLVIVNLAQAAAGRREFWVALDAQRRGRGVQVLTFRCINLAGYGPHDPDEAGQLADLEVDGMLGIMHLVEAVRTRLPLQGTTGNQPAFRLNTTNGNQASAQNMPTNGYANSTAFAQGSSQMNQPIPASSQTGYPSQAQQSYSQPQPAPTMQSTSQPGYPAQPQQSYAQPAPTIQPSYSQPVYSQSQPVQNAQPTISQPLQAQPTNYAPSPQSSAPPAQQQSHAFTDKIRAVIYPSSRSFSPVPPQESSWAAQNIQGTVPLTGNQPAQVPIRQSAQPPPPQPQPMYPRAQAAPSIVEPEEQRYQARPQPQAAQTVQPVQEPLHGYMQAPPASGYTQSATMNDLNESSLAQLSRLLDQFSPAQEQRTYQVQEVHPEPPARQPEQPAIQSVPLRPAPIQDIPLEREPEYRSERYDTRDLHTPSAYYSTSTGQSHTGPELSSIKMVVPPASTSQAESNRQPLPSYMPEPTQASPDRMTLSHTEKRERERSEEETAKENLYAGLKQELTQRALEGRELTSDTTLLDIVQSLPPMAPPQPAPILNGRASRSLGNVLLEGHLVPQDRLEVAQNVQRMLRGVDLNYQLGEILLLFKLLTPDQLLAASLVSYGLITTAQIRSLGRIRQELHSMGMEYDLENLIILFRILTPDQLREVRSSWST